MREMRDAALRVEQNRQRIETAQLGRELAEQRLDAEQRRFEVGMSTSFLVIQAQRDLAVARNNELQASLDYQLAVVAFESVAESRRPVKGGWHFSRKGASHLFYVSRSLASNLTVSLDASPSSRLS